VRAPELSTPAVVLRTRALRDADLIVILSTPAHGKIDCIARGARRSLRRFPGGLPVGARGVAEVGRGRGSLSPLSMFTPSFDHSGLGRDLEAFAYVNYLCELTDQLVGGATPDPTSFGLLCEGIEAAMAGARPGQLRRFELALLDGLGLLPVLDRCSVCASEALADERGFPYSVDRGGVSCLAHGGGMGRVTQVTLDLAAVLLEGEPEARAEAYASADPETRRDLRDLCRDAVAKQLRAPLRSLSFFAQIATPARA